MLKVLLACLVFFIVPLGSWISARILLPEMGLTVPSFSAFFWSSFFVLIMAIVVQVITAVIKD